MYDPMMSQFTDAYVTRPLWVKNIEDCNESDGNAFNLSGLFNDIFSFWKLGEFVKICLGTLGE